MADESPALRDLGAVLACAEQAQPAREQVLGALSLIAGVRRELDRLESSLIQAAREQQASWAHISRALGLASRQAGEQRWLRLAGVEGRDPGRVRESRQRQRNIDTIFGPPVAELRRVTAAAHRRLAADPAWDGRHPRAALARMSLEAAAGAPPGGLYALVAHALDDLAVIPTAGWPPALAAAVTRLREVATSATAAATAAARDSGC